MVFTVVWAYLAEQGNRIVYSVWHITKNSSELSRMPVETWEARAVLYFSSDFPHTCDPTKLWFSCVPLHKERIYWHWTTEYSLSEHHLVLNNPAGVSETTSLPLLAWHSTQTPCTELSSAQLRANSALLLFLHQHRQLCLASQELHQCTQHGSSTVCCRMELIRYNWSFMVILVQD